MEKKLYHTDCTPIQISQCVLSMSYKQNISYESFLTLAALIWFLASIWSHIHCKITFLNNLLLHWLHLHPLCLKSSYSCLHVLYIGYILKRVFSYWLHLYGFSLVCGPLEFCCDLLSFIFTSYYIMLTSSIATFKTVQCKCKVYRFLV